MLYEIAKEVQARLSDRGYPLKFQYDERGFDIVTPTENIALIQYSESGDDFGPPRAPGQNARTVIECDTGFQILICGFVTKAGARIHDHKRIATHNRNALLCELAVVLGKRRNVWTSMSGSFLRPDAGVTNEYGAKYMLVGAIKIGIQEPAVPTATIESFETTTAVATPGLEDSADDVTTTPPLPALDP